MTPSIQPADAPPPREPFTNPGPLAQGATGRSKECCFVVLYGEWYGVCDFVVLSVVEVCADYGGMNVCHVCFNFGIIYGVRVCVNVV